MNKVPKEKWNEESMEKNETKDGGRTGEKRSKPLVL